MLYSKLYIERSDNELLTVNLKTPTWWPNRQITSLMRKQTRVLIEYSVCNIQMSFWWSIENFETKAQHVIVPFIMLIMYQSDDANHQGGE